MLARKKEEKKEQGVYLCPSFDYSITGLVRQ